VIHQPRFNLLQREPLEHGVFDAAAAEGMGLIAFSPLAQGLLTGKYLKGIPEGSRATHGKSLNHDRIPPEYVRRAEALHGIAKLRGQSLAQLALAWVLSDSRVTSALMGASRVEQIEEAVAALAHADFSAGELAKIDQAVA
jgi:L-glyceraldehyde 3-phosphate reductase